MARCSASLLLALAVMPACATPPTTCPNGETTCFTYVGNSGSTPGGVTAKSNGPATHFAVQGLLPTMNTGALIAISVAALDVNGALAVNYAGSITFSSSDNLAVLPRVYTFASADQGAHTFAGVEFGSAGTQQITVNDTRAATITGSVSITVHNGTAVIGAGTVSSEVCSVLTNGQVKCWGWNPHGGLGYGDTQDRGGAPGQMGNNLPFVNLGNGRSALDVSTGGMQYYGDGSFACVVLDTQHVTCWGANTNGQLGVGDTTDRTTPPAPIAMPGGQGARSISAGKWSACAVLAGGQVTCWGANQDGELGVGDTTQRNAPGPVLNFGGQTATQVSVGDFFACAVLSNGGVSCWGDNGFGELGVGDTNQRLSPTPVLLPAGAVATSVSAASGSACALLSSGQVMCWGYNGRGYLGMGDTVSRNAPSAVVNFGTPLAITALSTQCALRADGNVTCWGYNAGGELGLGDTAQRNAPANVVNLGAGASVQQIVASGGGPTCALLSDASVHCWGGNDHGQLGLGDTQNRGDTPSDAPNTYPASTL